MCTRFVVNLIYKLYGHKIHCISLPSSSFPSFSLPPPSLPPPSFPPSLPPSLPLSPQNETGAASPSNDNTIIFTTFLKARIKCSSGSGMNGDLPFHFNNLRKNCDSTFIRVSYKNFPGRGKCRRVQRGHACVGAPARVL